MQEGNESARVTVQTYENGSTGLHQEQAQEYQEHYVTHDAVYDDIHREVERLVITHKPESVLEIGFGGAQWASTIATKYPSIRFTIVNNDNNMVAEAEQNVAGLDNVEVINCDGKEFVRTNRLRDFNAIVMIYNFHHIYRVTENHEHMKRMFLDNCAENMRRGAFLFIADLFLPENCNDRQLDRDPVLESLYSQRQIAAKTATFWKVLTSQKLLNNQAVYIANLEAENAFRRENQSLVKVQSRDGEYLVKKSFIYNACANKLAVINRNNEDINSVGDAIMILQK